MRFSRYVQLDQVCCTLMEAVDYIQGHDDSDLCRELLNNGAQMFRDFYTILMQFQSDWKNTKTKELLDEIICKWQDPLPDTIKERLEELRISLKEDIVIQIRAVFFCGTGWQMGFYGICLLLYVPRPPVRPCCCVNTDFSSD